MNKNFNSTNNMKAALGNNFCGPDELPHAQEILIAKFDKGSDDGYEVELYCTAYPAQAFRIKALDSKDSSGELRKGFTVVTGTGVFEWVVYTARLINEGMAVVKSKE